MSEPIRALVLFGTRPEVIKLAPVIGRLREDGRFLLRTVGTSQHREMVEGLLRLFAIEPDHDLGIQTADQTLADISTRALAGLDPIVRAERPDIMLIQGDTTSAMIGALVAAYHKVAVGHVEAGLRSYDRLHPFPEEINRRMISVVGDLHFAPLPRNERNLLREGVPPESIHVTGNTVIDALQEVLARGPGGLDRHLPAGALAGRRLVLVTAHRRESFDGALAALCHGLVDLISSRPDTVVVYPVHLNPNVRRAVLPILGGHDRIHLLEPLPYEAFVEAMSRSYLIVTDSGGIQEEAPSLGKPVLVFRKVTERGDGEGSRLVGLDREALVREGARLLDDHSAYRAMTSARNVYGDGHASRRIVEAMLHRFGRGARPERFAGG